MSNVIDGFWYLLGLYYYFKGENMTIIVDGFQPALHFVDKYRINKL